MPVRGVIYFSYWIDTLSSSAPAPTGGHDGLTFSMQEVCVSCSYTVMETWPTSRICVHGSFDDEGERGQCNVYDLGYEIKVHTVTSLVRN
jgi:hypothetical protein